MATKKISGYRIDFTTDTLIMNYKFYAASQQYGSPEYNLVKSITKDFPNLTVSVQAGREVTTANKNKRMTYKNMKKHIEAYRSNVDPDDEDMARYFQMKSKYLEETRKSAENLELRQSEAAAWSATYKKLWREFQCCYYTCNGLVFNAIGEDYIFEIYELAQEIAAPPTIPLPVERKITTKEEYRETWFNL